jgi:hypothetical protein
MTCQPTALLASFIAFTLIAQGCASTTTQDAAKPSQTPTEKLSTAPRSATNYPAVGVINLIQVGEVFSSKYQPQGVKKELVYVSNSGSIINFVYKEFKGNSPQASVKEDAKYDVSKTGKYFSHRGAQFEIRSASSTSLTYKTLKEFD